MAEPGSTQTLTTWRTGVSAYAPIPATTAKTTTTEAFIRSLSSPLGESWSHISTRERGGYFHELHRPGGSISAKVAELGSSWRCQDAAKGIVARRELPRLFSTA